MAHLAKISSLTDELITILTTFSPKHEAATFNALRDSALKTLRYQNYARIDHFEVQHNLEGLEEKCRVYNRDDLADAIHERVDELGKRSLKWSPEILYLLLELSDKPVANSNVEDLKFLKEPEVVEPPLKWEELVAEDPLLQDKNVWRNIDYGGESSDDGGEFLDSDVELSDLTETTLLSSVVGDNHRQASDFEIPISHDALEELRKSQFWGEKSRPRDYNVENLLDTDVRVSELQAIREILFMLAGLPTSLFSISTDTTSIRPNPGFALAHLSLDMFYSVLGKFAQDGTVIMKLRSWAESPQTTHLLQTLQYEIQVHLRSLDKDLSALQSNFVEPAVDVVVSIVEIREEINSRLHPLVALSEIISKLTREQDAPAFRYLELLYNEACASQMAGDDSLYRFMATLFFDCFRAYLQSIRLWMEEGELKDDVFFILRSDGNVEPSKVWQDRFTLRKTITGDLYAPVFLHDVSSTIFAAGKSVVVLKLLGRHVKTNNTKQTEPDFDFASVCKPAEFPVIPFSQLFGDALEQWLQKRHQGASTALAKYLLDNCGLRTSLRAFHSLYFMTDGAISAQLANGIFEKLDSGSYSWNDPFTLSELVQTTVGEIPGVSSELLRPIVIRTRPNNVLKARRSVKTLNAINFVYRIPWAVQIVLSEDTVRLYQRIFTFLLQIRRAASIINSNRLLQDPANFDSAADERSLYYSLRSRLLWFTSTLYTYLSTIVLQNGIAEFEAALIQAGDVDRMIDVHQSHIKSLTDQALLGPRLVPIHKSIITILDLSIRLSDARRAHASSQELQNTSVNSTRKLPVRPTRRGMQNDPDSTDEESDSGLDAGDTGAAHGAASYVAELRSMRTQFDQLCRFVSTGLRGVARAGGEPNWGLLAEILECGIGSAV